ncbi:MAG TPA: AI-2E family transporter [Gemmatimonadaceae bacterium]|nr:AI-2E family transporter [Gemmatimonadaceae bacterium]
MTGDKDPGLVSKAVERASRSDDSSLTPTVNPSVVATPVVPGAPAPDITRTGDAVDSRRGRSVEATLLTALALLYTLYFAREFLIPIVFALLLNFLLSPLIRRLVRLHIKPPISAAFLVLLLIVAVGEGAYQLAGPAQRWALTAPQSFARAQGKLRSIIRPVQQVTSNVQRAADAVGGPTEKKAPAVVVQAGPSVSSRLFGTTQRIAAGLLEIFILLYFLLAGGDLFLQKLIKVLPHFNDKVKAVEIARATEAAVSAYLSTALLVNVVEGALVAAVLWMLGMPNVLLWGALVACFEFVPYLGALAAVVVLTVAGLTTYDEVGRALLVPGSFLAINLLQANLITPMLLGHRLTLNPVAIFIGLAFFFWIWGVPGAFLAVPLLATFKIFCDHIASLAAIGEFLGQRDEEERRATARVSMIYRRQE